MNEDTARFETVEQYRSPAPEAPSGSRALTAVAVTLGVLLGIALIALFALLVGGNGEPVSEPVAPRVEATATVALQPAEPAPAPQVQPASNGGNVAPHLEDPPPPPPEDPPPPPETFIHPLEGTLWDVMVLSDGAGSSYDIHPSYPRQIEFRDGRVYSTGPVNGGSAEYSISGDEYGWGNDFMCGPIMTTMMLGPAEAMNQEHIIHTALESAAYYEVFENTLFIRDGSGTDLLICDIVPGG